MGIEFSIPTGALNALRRLPPLEARVAALEAQVASLLASKPEMATVDGFSDQDKVRIVRELRALTKEERPRLYEQYGITAAHFRSWSALDKE